MTDTENQENMIQHPWILNNFDCKSLKQIHNEEFDGVFEVLPKVSPMTIKFISKKDQETYDYFADELKKLISCKNNPNIVQIKDFHCDPIKHEFILAYEKNVENLANILPKDKKLSHHDILQMLSDMANGLILAKCELSLHHLNIKPSNILIYQTKRNLPNLQTYSVTNDNIIYKLVDFGSTISESKDNLFCSPELLGDNYETLNFEKCDIYSLALTAVHCSGISLKEFSTIKSLRNEELHDKAVKEIILSKLIITYPIGFVDLIDRMLFFDNKKRINLEILIKKLTKILKKEEEKGISIIEEIKLNEDNIIVDDNLKEDTKVEDIKNIDQEIEINKDKIIEGNFIKKKNKQEKNKAKKKIEISNEPIKYLINEKKIIPEQETKNDIFIVSKILSSTTRPNKKFLKQLFQRPIKELVLWYRGSENDFTAQNFHEKCNEKGENLVVIRSEKGNIFGGYCSVSWRGGENLKYRSAPGSFLFSLDHKTKHYLKDEQSIFAISCDDALGPTFGEYKFDLYVSDRCNKNSVSYSDLGHIYQLPKDTEINSKEALEHLSGSFHNFYIEEYEVFGIIYE